MLVKKKKKAPRAYAIVDLETTGLHGTHDRIIELAVLRVENNRLVDSYTTLVNPQTYVSPFIERFTGIRKEELVDAPVFAQIRDKVLPYLEGAVFVAHNARFDYGFMRAEMKRTGLSWTAKTLCTVKLSRRLFPGERRHGLDALIKRHALDCTDRHRAYGDAHLIWQFLEKMHREMPEEILESSIDALLKSSYSGSEAVRSQIEELPDAPGVYIFRDDKNTPLYVGKSKNIHERVISHFSQDYASSRELEIVKNTVRIDFIQTAGELGALVEESRLVKTLRPLHNRKLREKQAFVIARKQKDDRGYFTLKTETVSSLEGLNLDDILGVFKNKRSASEAMAHFAKTNNLCEKLCGSDHGKSFCFAYQLGRCRGACIGKEDPRLYNGRFLIAFGATQEFRPWPYPGAVEIIEKNDEEELYETFVVDGWKLLAGQKGEETLVHEEGFDIDTYKILSGYLRCKKPHIRPLAPGAAKRAGM